MRSFVKRMAVGGLLLTLSAAAQAELLYGVTTRNGLLRFDSAAPGAVSAVAISGLAVGENVLGIDVRPLTNELYGLGSLNNVYKIDPLSGAATLVKDPLGTPFALSGESFGFDFNPVPDRIRVTSDARQNLRLNPDTGALAATDGTLTFAVGDLNEGATPFVVGSAYTNSVSPPPLTTTLYNIDAGLDALLIQTPPNDGVLVTVGALGVDTSDLVGFDISGVSGVAFAALAIERSNESALYSIDLASGAASLIGTIGGGRPYIRGLAVAPEPGSLALLALGALGFRRRR